MNVVLMPNLFRVAINWHNKQICLNVCKTSAVKVGWKNQTQCEIEKGKDQEASGQKQTDIEMLTVPDNNVDNTSFYFRLHKLFNTKDK